MTDPYLVLAAELRALRAQKSRSPQLAFSSIEDGSIDENDADGNLVSSIGKQVDGTHGAVTLNGPVPPAPSAPVCLGGPGAITIDWDGGYAGDARRPLDYDFTDALVSSDPAMVGAVRAGSFVTAGSLTYTTWEAGTYYVALVTESKPGLRSAMSGVVQVVVEDTVTQANLDAADQRLVDARAELEAADAALTDALADSDADLTAAQGRLDTAEIELAEAQDRLDTAETTIANLPVENLTVTGTATINDAVAQNIAAASGQYIDLDVGQLNVTGTGTFKTAVMDEAFAEMFSTRKLTAGNVVIGNPSDFAPSLLETPDQWELTGGMAIVPSSITEEGYRFHRSATSGTGWAYGPWRKVFPGEKLYAEAWSFKSSDFTGGAFLRYYWYDKDDTRLSNYANAPQPSTEPSGTRYVIEEAVVPAGAAYARFVLALSDTATGYGGFFDAFGKSKTDGNLVALGSITAPKIVASEELFAKVSYAEMFQGQEYVGGTFTGALYQTMAAANSGIKIDAATNSQKAWNPAGDLTFHLDGDSGEFTAVGMMRTDITGARVEITDRQTGSGGIAAVDLYADDSGNHGALYTEEAFGIAKGGLPPEIITRTVLAHYETPFDVSSYLFLNEDGSWFLGGGKRIDDNETEVRGTGAGDLTLYAMGNVRVQAPLIVEYGNSLTMNTGFPSQYAPAQFYTKSSDGTDSGDLSLSIWAPAKTHPGSQPYARASVQLFGADEDTSSTLYLQSGAKSLGAAQIALVGEGPGSHIDLIGGQVLVNGRVMDDTGWVDVPIASGYSTTNSSERPQVRKIDGVVHLRGLISGTGLAANTNYQPVMTIPVEFRTSSNLIMAAGTAAGRDTAITHIRATGEVWLRVGTYSSSYYSWAGMTWPYG